MIGVLTQSLVLKKYYLLCALEFSFCENVEAESMHSLVIFPTGMSVIYLLFINNSFKMSALPPPPAYVYLAKQNIYSKQGREKQEKR